MNLDNTNIAVLMGGPGAEREVSLASGAGVAQALRSLGANVADIDVDGPDFHLPPDAEIVFNALHGTFGEDGQIQRILESFGVLYTGEGAAGSELAFDKIAAKRRFRERGIPTAPFEILVNGSRPGLPLPFVVKPSREGSSVGVSIVRDLAEFVSAVTRARRSPGSVFVEGFAAGREFTVGILGRQALPVIEIRARRGFYTFENKYPFLNPQAPGAEHLCPAPLSAEQTQLVQETALRAHHALDLEVYSRVDLILTEENQPIVLEVNTIPGMTPASLLPEAAAAVRIPYPALCARIIELSVAARRRTQ